MPPSGASRSIMSLSERQGFRRREREGGGGVVIGTELPVALQVVYDAGIDEASLYALPMSVCCRKSRQLFVSDRTVLMLWLTRKNVFQASNTYTQ